MDKHNSPACGRTQAGRAAPLTAFISLAKDANRCDWERLLHKVLRQLGFGSYLISLGPAAPRDTDPLAGLITTFPKRWLEHYRCDGLIEIDPILRHCRRELVPFFWDSERRRARGRSRHFWQQREQHGLRSGLSIPLRYELLRGTLSVALDDTQITEQEAFSNPAVYQLFMLIPYLLAGMRHQLQGPADNLFEHGSTTINEFGIAPAARLWRTRERVLSQPARSKPNDSEGLKPPTQWGRQRQDAIDD
ncbi:autoinducer binding domain-containing protein [Pseudomonas frederiksbergensis]|uniref:autoinducer binding domain-containing protein n=1 Tax=Pseudomonas frederiksbergensis TaxID=104087 RepID=UPI00218244E9|nr:autoinducer binding domain-containing protein [Pseudomonas frederiksbergensis]